MTEKLVSGLLATLVTGLAFGGWHLHSYVTEELASKDEVQVAGAKADYVLDRQIEATVKQIAFLEQKTVLTPAELKQLEYLRKQLEIMREVRRGK